MTDARPRARSLDPEVAESLGIAPDASGVLASQHLRRAIHTGLVGTSGDEAADANVQPASLDLRLGETAFRVRCSFLPDDEPVETKVKDLMVDEIDLSGEGAILETNRPYLIPLRESLALPPGVRGKANPKSSTGRLDVFTRVVTDRNFQFDEVPDGYQGPLWLEVVPLSFPVRVRSGLSLNQLRLSVGRGGLDDDGIRALHAEQPLLFEGGRPVADGRLAVAHGLFVSLDLQGAAIGQVGYRAKQNVPPLDMSKVGAYQSETYWEPVMREPGDRVVLDPERFYLLLSREAVLVPPGHAAEMTAYDPTSGELRTHYAGFFDPGFGYDPEGVFLGSRAALEVRAHDVPFMIEHGQRVCKLTFERMLEEPDVLYGHTVGSNYQQQIEALSKHFLRDQTRPPAPRPDQAGLFDPPT